MLLKFSSNFVILSTINLKIISIISIMVYYRYNEPSVYKKNIYLTITLTVKGLESSAELCVHIISTHFFLYQICNKSLFFCSCFIFYIFSSSQNINLASHRNVLLSPSRKNSIKYDPEENDIFSFEQNLQ